MALIQTTASYVALAEAMHLVRVTADRKLVNADGPRCEIIAV